MPLHSSDADYKPMSDWTINRLPEVWSAGELRVGREAPHRLDLCACRSPLRSQATTTSQARLAGSLSLERCVAQQQAQVVADRATRKP